MQLPMNTKTFLISIAKALSTENAQPVCSNLGTSKQLNLGLNETALPNVPLKFLTTLF